MNITGNILKMLQKRGYVAPDRDAIMAIYADADKDVSKEMVSFIAQKPTVDDTLEHDTVYVFHVLRSTKLGVREMEKIVETMQAVCCSHGIIINEKIPPHTRKIASSYSEEKGIRMECFASVEFVMDITEHELQPRFVLLKEHEKQQMLKEMTILESQLPRIPMDDAIARYYGALPGQVFQIIRASPTAGTYTSYRVVALPETVT